MNGQSNPYTQNPDLVYDPDTQQWITRDEFENVQNQLPFSPMTMIAMEASGVTPSQIQQMAVQKMLGAIANTESQANQTANPYGNMVNQAMGVPVEQKKTQQIVPQSYLPTYEDTIPWTEAWFAGKPFNDPSQEYWERRTGAWKF